MLNRNTTQKVWGQPVNSRQYRQLSIGITEKHVQVAGLPGKLHTDTGAGADPDAVFAWQSGHRPRQRARVYGLDGAFPTRLQPALLQAYARASHAWHAFLHLGNINTHHQLTYGPVLSSAINPSEQCLNAAAALPPTEQQHYSSKRPLDVTSSLSLAKRQCCPAISLPEDPPQINPEDPPQATYLHGWPPYLHMLPESRVVCCTIHKSCYTRQNLSRHLREEHRIMLPQRSQILANPCLQGSALAATPADAIHPADGSPEIAGLPSVFGFVCHIEGCTHRTGNQDRIRQHYNKQHQWQVQVLGPMPWRQAYLQTLFQQKQHIKYFTVVRSVPEP